MDESNVLALVSMRLVLVVLVEFIMDRRLNPRECECNEASDGRRLNAEGR